MDGKSFPERGIRTGFVIPAVGWHRIVAKTEALTALGDRPEAAPASADTTRRRLLETRLHEAPTPYEETEETRAAA